MNLRDLARRTAVLGNMLVTASVFLVLIWWRASLLLVVTGWVVYGTARLMDGSVRSIPLFTAPE